MPNVIEQSLTIQKIMMYFLIISDKLKGFIRWDQQCAANELGTCRVCVFATSRDFVTLRDVMVSGDVT